MFDELMQSMAAVGWEGLDEVNCVAIDCFKYNEHFPWV